jgi:hypothetical protein
MPCSRGEWEMGTQVIQNPLLARTTDTSLSLKDKNDIYIQRESHQDTQMSGFNRVSERH